MEIDALEKAINRLYSNRKSQALLNQQIKDDTIAIKEYMSGRRKLSLGRYIVRLVSRRKITPNLEAIHELIRQGLVSKEILKETNYDVLQLISEDEVRLDGRTFVHG